MPTSSPLDAFVPGYPRLAAQIALRPELGLYRRFPALNTRVILYLQAEIIALEGDLKQCEHEDYNSGDERSLYCQNAIFLSTSHVTAHARQDPQYQRQRDIMARLRPLLVDYNQAVLQQAALNAMEEPKTKDIVELQNFLEGEKMSFVNGCHLNGDDRQVWGSTKPSYRPHAPDLVSTVKYEEQDPFTRWCAEKVLGLFWSQNGAKFLNPDPVRGDVFVKGSKIERFTYYLTTSLAPLLLVVSIIALYLVKSMAVRLTLVAVFTVVLSLAVAVFTSTPRSQIFAITAAFAAVQVVFMATDNSCDLCRPLASSNNTAPAV